MVSRNIKKNDTRKIKGRVTTSDMVVVFFASLFFTVPALAADLPTVQSMLYSLRSSFPDVTYMVLALSYVMGMYMIYRAVYELKQYGEARTMMASHTDLRGPIVMILVGACLIYLGSAIQTGVETLFGDWNPLSYPTGEDTWTQAIMLVYDFMRLIGIIAFIRGLMLMASTGKQGAPPNTFGKALTHIIGGVLAINLEGTMSVLYSTLGLNTG